MQRACQKPMNEWQAATQLHHRANATASSLRLWSCQPQKPLKVCRLTHFTRMIFCSSWNLFETITWVKKTLLKLLQKSFTAFTWSSGRERVRAAVWYPSVFSCRQSSAEPDCISRIQRSQAPVMWPGFTFSNRFVYVCDFVIIALMTMPMHT